MLEPDPSKAGSQDQVTIPEGDWRLNLPEEMRANTSLAPYKVIPAGTKNDKGEELPEVPLVQVPRTMVKSYIDQQPLIGSKLIKPKEGASEEELDKFYAEIGMPRPEAPEKYEFKVDEKFQALPYSKPLEEWFRNTAHKMRIPQDRAAELYQGYQEQMLGMFTNAETEINKENAEANKALEGKWAGKAKENMTLADRAFHTLFPWAEDETDPTTKEPTLAAKTKYLLRTILGNNSFFIEAMHNLAPLYGEHLVVVDGGGEASLGAAKSREELRKMRGDPRYEKDPKYRAMVDAEYARAFPGNAA